MSREQERPTFSLVHGRYHGGWCWQFVQEALNEQGWSSIAPTLAIENPDLSLEAHAAQVDKEEQASGAENIVRVGWSWGANVILRSLTDAPPKAKLIFVAGALQPSSLPHISKDRLPKFDRSISYQIIVDDPAHNLRGMAGDTFYNDIKNDQLKDWAISQLRDHPNRNDYEPALQSWPTVPMEYIRTTRDLATPLRSQTRMAQLAGIEEPVSLDSGHTPMLSRPRELAGELIRLASR